MKPSRIIFWSAVTTIAGSYIVGKTRTRVPGFSR